MKKNTSLLLHLIFAVIVIVELAGRLLDNIQMEYFAIHEEKCFYHTRIACLLLLLGGR